MQHAYLILMPKIYKNYQLPYVKKKTYGTRNFTILQSFGYCSWAYFVVLDAPEHEDDAGEYGEDQGVCKVLKYTKQNHCKQLSPYLWTTFT